MPLAQSGTATSHRRSLTSRSLATNTSKLTLSTRVPSHPKLSALGRKRNTEIEFSCISGDHSITVLGDGAREVDHDMTFLQYCPVCDKQILVPNSIVLYCSESCRRKDSLSTTPPPELKLALRSPNPMISPTSPTSIMAFRLDPFDDSSSEDQPALPLFMTSASLPVRTSKPPELHSFKQDLDPTEWKPNSTPATSSINAVSAVSPSFVVPELHTSEPDHTHNEGSTNSETTVLTHSTTRDGPAAIPRRQSAAFGYLAQFHRSSSSFLSLASKRPSLRTRGSSASASASISTGTGIGGEPGNRNANSRTSRPSTPAMSISRSSASSAASSSSGIALCAPSHQHAFSGITSHDGASEDRSDSDDDGVPVEEGLTFGKQTLANAQAIGLTGARNAEGSLRGLLANAA